LTFNFLGGLVILAQGFADIPAIEIAGGVLPRNRAEYTAGI
jgi:hypothetical protein